MKYEIRKRGRDGKMWSFYACTDLAENAFEVCDSLNCYSPGEYAVFAGNKQIKNLKEAMEK